MGRNYPNVFLYIHLNRRQLFFSLLGFCGLSGKQCLLLPPLNLTQMGHWRSGSGKKTGKQELRRGLEFGSAEAVGAARQALARPRARQSGNFRRSRGDGNTGLLPCRGSQSEGLGSQRRARIRNPGQWEGTAEMGAGQA